MPAERPVDLRPRNAARIQSRAGRSRELPRALVQLSATSSRSAGNLSLPVHGAKRVWPRGTWGRYRQSSRWGHGFDSAGSRSRASFGSRLRHVLPVDDSPSPRQPIHRLYVCGGARVGAGFKATGLAPCRLTSRPHMKNTVTLNMAAALVKFLQDRKSTRLNSS